MKNKKNKCLVLFIMICILTIIGISGCDDTGLTLPLSNDCAITSYSFKSEHNDVLDTDFSATISDTNISITLPNRTDRSNLKASFSMTGTAISVGGVAQTSGESGLDFSSGPVVYTVTAADSTSKEYTVNVDIAAASDKEITEFSFSSANNPFLSSDLTAEIENNIITVITPTGIDLTSLVATFTTTASVVKVNESLQISGTTDNNFTDSVEYTAVAEDGTTNVYTVRILLPVTESTDFGTSTDRGDTAAFTFNESGLEVNMIMVNDTAGIHFMNGSLDNIDTIMPTAFLMSEHEFTNALAVEVLNWAYSNSKMEGSYWLVDTATVDYADVQLLNLGSSTEHRSRVDFSGSGFVCEDGFENNPLMEVSIPGAIILCNWLTEMRDGNTDNLAYTWNDLNSDNTWTILETILDVTKNGYRLPTYLENCFAEKIIGDTNSDGDFRDEGEFYPYNFISGSDAVYNAVDSAADYDGDGDIDYAEDVAWGVIDPVSGYNMAVGLKKPNASGLYDVSGNINEFSFTAGSETQQSNGGNWTNTYQFMQISWSTGVDFSTIDVLTGFRLTRTAE